MYKNFKQLRIEKNLTLDELALLTGMSKLYLYNLENGFIKDAEIEDMGKLALALECEMSDICFAFISTTGYKWEEK